MFGPGGQPILMGQIPIIPQQFQQQHAPQSSGQVLPPKEVPHMSEEKLQEKGMYHVATLIRFGSDNAGFVIVLAICKHQLHFKCMTASI